MSMTFIGVRILQGGKKCGGADPTVASKNPALHSQLSTYA